MLVHHRVTPTIKFAGTHLYTWVERGTVEKRLPQKNNTRAGLDVATCGVANATGFGPLATNFSHLVASLATAISSYFIFIYFFISQGP